MGLLDSVIGSVTGQSQGGGTSPIVKALLLLLAAKAASSYMSHGSASTAPSAPVPQGGDGTINTGILKGLPGLDAILDKFRGAGHGDKVQSWIGTGPNAPVKPTDVEHALGDDTLNTLTQQTGMPRDQLVAQLSGALPQVVDKLTPEGRLPAATERAHW